MYRAPKAQPNATKKPASSCANIKRRAPKTKRITLAPLLDLAMQPPLKRHVVTPANDTPQSAFQPQPHRNSLINLSAWTMGTVILWMTKLALLALTRNPHQMTKKLHTHGGSRPASSNGTRDMADNAWGWGNWGWAKETAQALPAPTATYET